MSEHFFPKSSQQGRSIASRLQSAVKGLFHRVRRPFETTRPSLAKSQHRRRDYNQRPVNKMARHSRSVENVTSASTQSPKQTRIKSSSQPPKRTFGHSHVGRRRSPSRSRPRSNHRTASSSSRQEVAHNASRRSQTFRQGAERTTELISITLERVPERNPGQSHFPSVLLPPWSNDYPHACELVAPSSSAPAILLTPLVPQGHESHTTLPDNDTYGVRDSVRQGLGAPAHLARRNHLSSNSKDNEDDAVFIRDDVEEDDPEALNVGGFCAQQRGRTTVRSEGGSDVRGGANAEDSDSWRRRGRNGRRRGCTETDSDQEGDDGERVQHGVQQEGEQQVAHDKQQGEDTVQEAETWQTKTPQGEFHVPGWMEAEGAVSDK